MPATATVPVLSYQELIQLSKEREQHIEEIKDEIANEVDNPNGYNLFEQLTRKERA